jgi:hypothetical protein
MELALRPEVGDRVVIGVEHAADSSEPIMAAKDNGPRATSRITLEVGEDLAILFVDTQDSRRAAKPSRFEMPQQGVHRFRPRSGRSAHRVTDANHTVDRSAAEHDFSGVRRHSVSSVGQPRSNDERRRLSLRAGDNEEGEEIDKSCLTYVGHRRVPFSKFFGGECALRSPAVRPSRKTEYVRRITDAEHERVDAEQLDAHCVEQRGHLRNQSAVAISDIPAQRLEPVENAPTNAGNVDDQRLLIGVDNNECSASRHHTCHLTQRSRRINKMLEHAVGTCPAQRPTREGQRMRVGATHGDSSSCRRLDHRRGRIDTDTLVAEGNDIRPRTTTNVDNAAGTSEQIVRSFLVGTNHRPRAHSLLPRGSIRGVRACIDIGVRLTHARCSRSLMPSTAARALRRLEVFYQRQDVGRDGVDPLLPVDNQIEHAVVAKVLDHRLLVVEPLDIGPAFLGEPHRVTTPQLRLRNGEERDGEASPTQFQSRLDGQ